MEHLSVSALLIAENILIINSPLISIMSYYHLTKSVISYCCANYKKDWTVTTKVIGWINYINTVSASMFCFGYSWAVTVSQLTSSESEPLSDPEPLSSAIPPSAPPFSSSSSTSSPCCFYSKKKCSVSKNAKMFSSLSISSFVLRFTYLFLLSTFMTPGQ